MGRFDRKQLWVGAEFACNNAKQLLASARDAGARNSFGLGSALAILCSEECAKAISLVFHGFGHQFGSIPLEKYFHSHKHKHVLAAVFLMGVDWASSSEPEIDAILEDDSIPEGEQIAEIWKHMIGLAEKDISDDSDISNHRAFIWLEEADRLKKRGLYVGYSGNAWETPEEIGADIFHIQLDRAESLLKLVESLMEIGHDNMLKYYQDMLAMMDSQAIPQSENMLLDNK